MVRSPPDTVEGLARIAAECKAGGCTITAVLASGAHPSNDETKQIEGSLAYVARILHSQMQFSHERVVMAKGGLVVTAWDFATLSDWLLAYSSPLSAEIKWTYSACDKVR